MLLCCPSRSAPSIGPERYPSVERLAKAPAASDSRMQSGLPESPSSLVGRTSSCCADRKRLLHRKSQKWREQLRGLPRNADGKVLFVVHQDAVASDRMLCVETEISDCSGNIRRRHAALCCESRHICQTNLFCAVTNCTPQCCSGLFAMGLQMGSGRLKLEGGESDDQAPAPT